MPYSWEKTLNADMSGSNYNMRNVLLAANISVSGSQIRVRAQAHSGGDCIINGCSIGERDGSTVNMVDTPVRITWDSGNNGTTVPGGGEKWSDWIEFDLDETKTYLVHFALITASNWKYLGSGGDDVYLKNTSDDETMIQSPTGYGEFVGYQWTINALDASVAAFRSVDGSLHKDAEVGRKGMLNRTLSGDF